MRTASAPKTMLMMLSELSDRRSIAGIVGGEAPIRDRSLVGLDDSRLETWDVNFRRRFAAHYRLDSCWQTLY